MKKLYTPKTFFENDWWEDAYPSSYPSGHKVGKPSKKSGLFQSLGTISFTLFTKRQSQKGGHGPMPPKYAPVLPVRRPAVEKRCISE